MKGFDYGAFDGLGLAQLVREREVSAGELLAEAQARLAAVNPSLNAVTTPMDSLAKSLIDRLDRRSPFSGVPFLVKDLMLRFAGSSMSNGSVAMKDYVPPEDNDMARALNAAGLITFGKTTTSELGASPLALSAAFGETRNPWNLALNSGGSSGGSSAAVAARVVPMAYSSDGGGSIRVPASYCGIFGFKPSRNLNKFEDLSRAWGGAVVSHVSTVSVRDSAAYLDVVSGRAAQGYSARAPAQDTYLGACMQTPKRLRIALVVRAPTGTAVHEECANAALNAAKCCQWLGHDVEEADWPFDGMELMRAFLTVVFHFTCLDVANMARLLNVDEKQMAIELNTRFMATLGSGIGDNRVRHALSVWRHAASTLSKFYKRFDLILTPTVATPPLPSHALDSNVLERLVMRALVRTGLGRKICSNAFLDAVIRRSLYLSPFTPVANVTGQPAMSVPLYWGADDLPHGAHFMAAEGNDRTLFQLASQLETEHPWRGKLPPFNAAHARRAT